MNKNKKGAAIIISIILIISLIFGGVGAYFNYVNSNNVDNPNKLFHYNDKLYFYDNNKELLGTYKCQNMMCSYAANNVSTDVNYGINYHKYDDNQIKLIDNTYAFISDYVNEENAILINVKTGEKLGIYDSVKNYGIGINNNYYIVSSNGNYGVIKVENNEVETVINFDYDYIGLSDNVSKETNKIDSELFIIMKNNNWKLRNSSNVIISEQYKPIVDYNNNSYVTKMNELYSVYALDNTLKLNALYKEYKYFDKYIEVLDTNNNYYIYDTTNNSLIKNITTTDNDNYKAKLNNNKIDIYNNDVLIESIEI